MSTRFSTKAILLIAVIAPGVMAYSSPVRASHPLDSAAVVTCGSLQSFLGVVQIFDATRTQVIDTSPGRKIQCGDWVSVETGKAVIQHKKGFQFKIGPGSFVQVLDPQSGDNTDHDHLALFRGQIEVHAPSGTTVRLATANGRATFDGSRAIALFNSDRHETQVIAIQGQTSLANRHLPREAVSIKPGTFSRVVPNGNRLQPSVPRGSNVKQLGELLSRFGISGALKDSVLVAAKRATETKIPKKLLSASKPKTSRAPASTKSESTPTAFVPVQGSALPGSMPTEIIRPQMSVPKSPRRVPASQVGARDWAKGPSQPALEKERKKVLEKLSSLRPESDDFED